MNFFNLLQVTLERRQVPPLSELRVPPLSELRIPPYLSEEYDLLTVLTQDE